MERLPRELGSEAYNVGDLVLFYLILPTHTHTHTHLTQDWAITVSEKTDFNNLR